MDCLGIIGNMKGNPTKRANLKHQFDLIMVTPWIGTDYEPNKNVVKNFLPYAGAKLN